MKSVLPWNIQQGGHKPIFLWKTIISVLSLLVRQLFEGFSWIWGAYRMRIQPKYFKISKKNILLSHHNLQKHGNALNFKVLTKSDRINDSFPIHALQLFRKLSDKLELETE